MLCHGLVEIDGSDQVIVKVAARVANTLTHSFKTREMDHSIKPVYPHKKPMKVINFTTHLNIKKNLTKNNTSVWRRVSQYPLCSLDHPVINQHPLSKQVYTTKEDTEQRFQSQRQHLYEIFLEKRPRTEQFIQRYKNRVTISITKATPL